LSKPFEAGTELSPKMELKRHTVTEMYKDEIKALFKD
jgi:long-subunit acyl-CoA synthetase (AMP-forming)